MESNCSIFTADGQLTLVFKKVPLAFGIDPEMPLNRIVKATQEAWYRNSRL